MKITRNTYIFLFVLLSLIYFFIYKNNDMSNEIFSNKIDLENNNKYENDNNNYENKMDEIISHPLNTNLLYNEVDMIKYSQNMPMHKFTGMFTDTNTYPNLKLPSVFNHDREINKINAII